jgi:methionyl-tRNA synthetase
MNIALQIAANLIVVSEPFMPFSAHKLAEMLGLNELSWKHAGSDALLEEGSKIEKPQLLFRKIEDLEIEAQLKKLETSKVENQMVNPQKENVSFEAFCSMDIRVGTIIAAEKVKKTKKLLKLTVDTGIDIRTIVSGIAAYYQHRNLPS